jgi:hypothetical protein
MLAIFSIPKPFLGHSDIIQRNAIQSWLRLEPHCEIFLCGNDRGVAEAASEFQVHHVPDIENNKYGTPLLSSAFRVVQQKADSSLLCYVNSDIILLNNIIDAVKIIPFQRFLLLGQRWNLDIDHPLDYDRPSWEKEIQEQLAHEGKLQPPFGSDYCIFPKDTNWDFPDFAVGRPGWDNWIIYRARALKMQVIDATEAVTVIHQNHNYAHIVGGVTPASFEGPEATRNRHLMGGDNYSFNLRDATHCLLNNSIKRAMDFPHLQYRLERQPVLEPSLGVMAKIGLRLLSALLYRHQYFPSWLWQNAIYFLTK